MFEAAKSTQKPALEALFEADELLRLIAEKDQQICDKDLLIIEQQKRLRILEEQLRLSRQHRFGAQSEKAPGQADLFDEAELEVDADPGARVRALRALRGRLGGGER